MPDPTENPLPAQRRTWPRRLAIIAAGVVVVLVVGYFVVTSAAFLKGVILPRVGRALNAEVTVTDASIHPFSRITLHGLAVKSADGKPVLQADQVQVGYGLRSILGGKIQVDEFTLASPVVEIVQRADGTSTLDPFLKPRPAQAGAAKPGVASPSQPMQLAVRAVSVRDATVRFTRESKDGGRESAVLSKVNISLDQLANGQAGKVTLGADLKFDRSQGQDRASLQSQTGGSIDFALGADLLPRSAKGSVTHDIVAAGGTMTELAGVRAVLVCDITPSEIKRLVLGFSRTNQPLGELKVSGPFDLARREGRVKLELGPIDRQVLNLVGALVGVDFGTTRLGSTLELEVGKGGSFIGAKGQFQADPLRLTQRGKSTPAIELNVGFSASADLNSKTGRLETLTLSGSQNQRPLLSGNLSRPMPINWGGATPTSGDSIMALAVTNFDLADWRGFLGDNVSGGRLNVRLKLASERGGHLLKADVSGDLQELLVQAGTNRIGPVAMIGMLTGQSEEFTNVNLEQYSLVMSQSNRTALSLSGSGRYQVSSNELTLQSKVEVSLPGALSMAGRRDLEASAGTLRATALYSQQGRQTNVSGSMQLSDLSGRYGTNSFDKLGSRLAYDLELKSQIVQLRRLALAVSQANHAGGQLDLTGVYDLGQKTGDFTFAATDFNQHALGPFLAPALTPNQLVSVSLNSKGKATLNASGESGLKADFTVTNLVVNDPQGKLAKTPLKAELRVDASMRQSLLTLREVALGLSPTARAKNELELAGRMDLTKTNAYSGALTLRAESLDLTPYYDLLAAKPQTAAKPAAPTSQTPASGPPGEPEAMTLPLGDVTFDGKVDRLFLRDLAVSNWVANARIHGSRVQVATNQLTLNGAPASFRADLDLGVKGWTYDVDFHSDKTPLEPIASTVSPETRGQYRGLILADAHIKGAGLTGTSLQKNLDGHFSLSFTNANLQLLGPKTQRIVVPIATLLRLEDLAKSPLNWLQVAGTMGAGRIELKEFSAQSEAFEAGSRGTIPIADVLTNSPLNLPVDFGLRRSLAQKAGLMPAGTPLEARYVKLPQFVTLKGTLGAPRSDLNDLVITGLLLKSGVGLAEKVGVNVGGSTGDVLRGLGNLLTGGATGATPTNQSATTNAPVNPLDLFRKKPAK